MEDEMLLVKAIGEILKRYDVGAEWKDFELTFTAKQAPNGDLLFDEMRLIEK